MVMKNRHNEAGPAGWWDDLPPRARARFGADTTEYSAIGSLPHPRGPAYRPTSDTCRVVPEWVRTLNGFALVVFAVLAVAIANMAILLVAVSYVASGSAGVMNGTADPIW